HPSYRRLSRYDETGLIWLLQGRPVVMLTAATAAIENPTGASPSIAGMTNRHLARSATAWTTFNDRPQTPSDRRGKSSRRYSLHCRAAASCKTNGHDD